MLQACKEQAYELDLSFSHLSRYPKGIPDVGEQLVRLRSTLEHTSLQSSSLAVTHYEIAQEIVFDCNTVFLILNLAFIFLLVVCVCVCVCGCVCIHVCAFAKYSGNLL